MKLGPKEIKVVNEYFVRPVKNKLKEIFMKKGLPQLKTPDEVQRPQSSLDREMFEGFNKRNPKADGGRMDFQFGGGADAQRMGTEASRVYFKNRAVDKPTPTFEGGVGKAKVTDAKFKNLAQEKEYIKILEDRFKFPKGSKEARKVASNADIAKKFGISLNNVERVNKALINKLNLEYPAQTYEGYEKIQRERDKVRKENIKKTSSTGVESKIKRDIKKVDATALAKNVDIAHRASLKANANLGAKYLTTSLGIDSKIINQKIIQPIEQKLGTLYENQKKLIKDYKPGDKIPKDVQKKLEKINIKISELADRTNGVLQGVLVDEKTLKPIIYGVDYSKVLGFGLVDKPVSELTQADRNIIKLNVEEQIKTAKKVNPKNTGMKLSANPMFNPGILKEAFKQLPTPAGAVGLNLAFGVDPRSSIDRASIAAEAAFAPALVKQAAKLGSVGQRIANLGLTPAMAARAARIASPLGIASLAAEGLYQGGKYMLERKKLLDSLTDKQRDELLRREKREAVGQMRRGNSEAFDPFQAAGGGLAKLAGDRSGAMLTSMNPDKDGLPGLSKRGKKQ